MTIYKSAAEVAAKLAERGFAEPHVVTVNKGHGDLSYIEWHEVVRMLDEVFGPFGWDAQPVASTSDYANGLYTYDIALVGRAIDDEGNLVSLTRPGRGLGLVPRSALNADAEHDRQAHGAKSDAITNASKALGDAFGLFLYKGKGNTAPATGSAARGNTVSTSTGAGAPRKGNGVTGPMFGVLINNGFSREDINAMTFDEAKAEIDRIKGGQKAS